MMARQTQHQRQEARHGKVPTKIGAKPRPFLAIDRPGTTPETAIVCGGVDDRYHPRLVETTGAVWNIRAGQTRWVIGDGVAEAVYKGLMVVVEDRPPGPPEPRPTRLPDGAPGSDPSIPGRLDQWKIGFTPCVRCTEHPSTPGEELCEYCLAEADGETPLERALRLAGT